MDDEWHYSWHGYQPPDMCASVDRSCSKHMLYVLSNFMVRRFFLCLGLLNYVNTQGIPCIHQLPFRKTKNADCSPFDALLAVQFH